MLIFNAPVNLDKVAAERDMLARLEGGGAPFRPGVRLGLDRILGFDPDVEYQSIFGSDRIFGFGRNVGCLLGFGHCILDLTQHLGCPVGQCGRLGGSVRI